MLWLSLRLKASIEEFDSEYLKPETLCQKTLKPNLYRGKTGVRRVQGFGGLGFISVWGLGFIRI